MKKLSLVCIVAVLILSGCSTYSEEEKALREMGVEDVGSCENMEALKAAGKTLIKEKAGVYCDIDGKAKHLDQATAFVKEGYHALDISAYLKLPYYHEDKTERYIAYAKKTNGKPEDVVTEVNIGLDKPYFTDVDTITEFSTTMVVNKYHKLPDGYKPEQMVKTPHACIIGKDFSCQSEPQYLVKEAAEAFEELYQAAAKEGFSLKAIASFRSYDYQKNLYDYNVKTQGKTYADTYYARPGQSEHNTGLALDVTINDDNFNEIEQSPHYSWFLSHLPDYGFILRYPSDKVDITGYGYESWHIRYVGKDTAKEIQKSGLTLEEYDARRTV